jgi:hypothetical protein
VGERISHVGIQVFVKVSLLWSMDCFCFICCSEIFANFIVVSGYNNKTNSVLNCLSEMKEVVFSIPSRARIFFNTL